MGVFAIIWHHALWTEGHVLRMGHITVTMREVIKTSIIVSSAFTDKYKALPSDIILPFAFKHRTIQAVSEVAYSLYTTIQNKSRPSVPKFPLSKSEVDQHSFFKANILDMMKFRFIPGQS